MNAKNSKSYLSYLNKLAGECNNSYHRSIVETLTDADYSALTEEIELTLNSPTVNDKMLMIKSGLLSSGKWSQ